MAVELPTRGDLKEIASEVGLKLNNEELEDFRGLMAGSIDSINQLEAMQDELPRVKYSRDGFVSPPPEENALNGWYVKTQIRGASSGKLFGKTIALKDNIMLADVPMMCGSSSLEGYTPEIDATVVERVLDAGGEIAGKAHCEFFCLSGGSHTNSKGPVHNHYKRGSSAGG